MKKYMIVLLAFLFSVPFLSAQDGGRRHRFRYDKSKEKTYSGVIVSVTERQGRRGPRQVVTFKTGGMTCRLSVGPGGWLAGKGITLAAGVKAVVVGVVHTGQRGSFLRARTINAAGKLVELLNSEGHPNWPRPPRHGGGN